MKEIATTNPASLTGGSLLARNAVFNLAGQSAPMLVALFAIPTLIHGLGTDRFGILTLAWMVIGYFTLFDLGLGRALTQVVAERLGAGKDQEIPGFFWTGFVLMLALGLLGAFTVGVLSPWLVRSALRVPVPLQAETLSSFYLLAVSLPIVVSTAGFAGFLSAMQRFGVLNAIRVPMSIFTFLGPLLVLPFSSSLVHVTMVLVIGRAIAWILHLVACLHVMPELRSSARFKIASVRPLLQFGTWMTMTNIIGPLMVYLDRFLIGALLSVSAVAYYATPYELVTKLWVIPGAIVGVLFPAFATSYIQDRRRVIFLSSQSIKYVFLLLFPITLLLVVFAKEGLSFWLGEKFSEQSSLVLQLLAIGVFVNSLAQVPFSLVQGIGRPDITAKLHLFELPFYLAILWYLLKQHGIEGAAIAWLGRSVVDAIILFALADKLLYANWILLQRLIFGGAVVIPIFLISASIEALMGKIMASLLLLLSYLLVAWFLLLQKEERQFIQFRLRLLGNIWVRE